MTEITHECPICFEILDTKVNCLTTECGHMFHSNCFMKHTAFNGYTCPCCRNKMIDEPDAEESDDEESLGSEDSRDYNYGGWDATDEEESLYSLRWFTQRLNNEALEEDEFGFSNESHEPGALPTDDVVYDENKDQVQVLIKRIKDINKLPYETLLAAYLTNCKDFKYNYYAEEMNYDVTHMINDIHERMLRTSPPATATANT